MKQPKKPILAQKKIIANNGLKWSNWMVIDEDKKTLTIINKISKNVRKVKK